jgi:hypothetical protein
MDVGIPLTRNRSRVGVTPITAALMLTKAQLETFDQFFVGQCVDGVLRFDWTDPRTKTPKSFRFTAVPVYEPVDPNVWRARVEVEELAP